MNKIKLIKLKKHTDKRGLFRRIFCKRIFKKINSFIDVKQINLSTNPKKGTLRGLHYQKGNFSEKKIIFCTKGKLFFVALNIDPKSKNYLKYESFTLNEKDDFALFVDNKYATGFLTLSGIKSLILPSITLGLYQLTLIMRLTRSEMLEVMRQDYVRFAKALGLSSKQVNYKHALPNTLVPVVTIAGLQLGSIVAFAIVTETVFQWPGVGLLFINAVYFVDIPVMSAYLLLVGVLFVIINLFVDLLYLAIDPRLRDSNSSE